MPERIDSMAYAKKTFTDGQTVIDAATLNAIQDELIRVAGLLGNDIQSAAINDSGHLILTLTDDTTLEAGVAKGGDGAKGDTGPSGADGVTPHIGDDGNWYLGDEDTGVAAKGVKGDTGAQGAKGADGHTPVKGTDYWTAADKAEMVTDVLAALPDGTEVNY